MLDPNGWICDRCGEELTHLGRGEFICTKCGNEVLLGEEDEWPEDGDDGYTYDEVFGEKPEVCRTCGGEYPSCKDSCNLFE